MPLGRRYWRPRLLPYEPQLQQPGRLRIPEAKFGPPLEMPEPPSFGGLPDFRPGRGGGTGGGTGGGQGPGEGIGSAPGVGESDVVFDVGTGEWVPRSEIPEPGAIETPPTPTGPGVQPTPQPPEPSPPTDVPVDMIEPPAPAEPINVSPYPTPDTPRYDHGAGEWVSEEEYALRFPTPQLYTREEEERLGVEFPRTEIPQEEIDYREELEEGGLPFPPLPGTEIPIEGGVPEDIRAYDPDDAIEQERRRQLEVELEVARQQGDAAREAEILDDLEASYGRPWDPATDPSATVGGAPGGGGGGGQDPDTIIGINPEEQENVPQTPEEVAANPRLESNFEAMWETVTDPSLIEPEREAMGENPNQAMVDFLWQTPGALEWAIETGRLQEGEGGPSNIFERILAGGRDVLAGALLTGAVIATGGALGVPGLGGAAGATAARETGRFAAPNIPLSEIGIL